MHVPNLSVLPAIHILHFPLCTCAHPRWHPAQVISTQFRQRDPWRVLRRSCALKLEASTTQPPPIAPTTNDFHLLLPCAHPTTPRTIIIPDTGSMSWHRTIRPHAMGAFSWRHTRRAFSNSFPINGYCTWRHWGYFRMMLDAICLNITTMIGLMCVYIMILVGVRPILTKYSRAKQVGGYCGQ